jgi:hypothetical protein
LGHSLQGLEIDGLSTPLDANQASDSLPAPRDPDGFAPHGAFDKLAQVRLGASERDLFHDALITIGLVTYAAAGATR